MTSTSVSPVIEQHSDPVSCTLPRHVVDRLYERAAADGTGFEHVVGALTLLTLSRLRPQTEDDDRPIKVTTVTADGSGVDFYYRAHWSPGVNCRDLLQFVLGESGPFPSVSASLLVEKMEHTLRLALLTPNESAPLEFGARLTHLADQVFHQPNIPLADLELLDAAETELLTAWNRTGLEYPGPNFAHDFITQQALEGPDRPAVFLEESILTYGDLVKRSNRLARILQASGVRPESRVAVALERSFDLVISVVAVLRAGGAYLPILPETPPQRLGWILEDAAPAVLLTHNDRSQWLDWGCRICLDEIRAELEAEREDAPNSFLTPSNLAYVIYTSGSTGKPKGVLSTHGGLRNRLLWMQDQFRLSSSDRVLHKTPISFDVSIWELLWPLMSGASIVLNPPERHGDPQRLRNDIQRHSVTVAHFVPSMLDVFLNDIQPGECASLRLVVSSGEALSGALVRQLRKRLSAELYNLYGPTEASIDVTYWKVPDDFKENTVPIGRPIANTRLYILDEALRLLPPGLPGELFIAGDGLARGYLGNPQLTAERFIQMRSGPLSGERIYRTGDIAVYSSDGVIRFCGRRDNQIKLRGNRIELGEIELTLEEHAGISRAIVVLREVPSGPALVAFVARRTGSVVVEHELRTFLGSRLPQYMIPSTIQFIDKFPVTENGKLDRNALMRSVSVVTANGRTRETNFDDPLECKVMDIWSDLLATREISADSRFFQLGGDSLLLTRALSKLRVELNSAFELKDFLGDATISDWARRIRAGMLEASGPSRHSRVHIGPIPASMDQNSIFLAAECNPESPAYHLSFAIRMTGVVQPELLRSCLSKILSRHESLRTYFEIGDGQLLQRVSDYTVPAFESASFNSLDEAIPWVQRYCRGPMDLSSGPLFRACLARLGDNDGLFAVTMHHIIADGWSWNVVKYELGQFLNELTTGVDATLPVLRMQYADYALLEQERLESGAIEDSLNWWEQTLEDAPPFLNLTNDPSRSVRFGAPAGIIEFSLPKGCGERLYSFSRAHSSTPFVCLLTSLAALLSQMSRQDDFVVVVPATGRTAAEWEPLIGLFVRILPLRIRVHPSDIWMSLFSRVRAAVFDALQHREVAFQCILERASASRTAGRPRFMDVMLILQNAVGMPSEIDPAWQEFEISNGAAKYDLKFDFAPRGMDFVGLLEYRTDLFPESRVRLIARQFAGLLDSLIEFPHMQIPLVNEVVHVGDLSCKAQRLFCSRS